MNHSETRDQSQPARPREPVGLGVLEAHGVEEVPDAAGHLEPFRVHDHHLVAAQLGPHGEEQPVLRDAGDEVVDVRNH
eukprot:10081900-Alexandrium_andersonii.AAC.1